MNLHETDNNTDINMLAKLNIFLYIKHINIQHMIA